MATFTQALEWLKQGRKVCREQWMHSSHIRLVGDAIDGDIKLFHSLDRLGGSYRDLCPQDVFATDWQLYDDGQQTRGSTLQDGKSNVDISASCSADTSLTTELSVSPSLAAKILKLAEKEGKSKPRKSRKARSKR